MQKLAERTGRTLDGEGLGEELQEVSRKVVKVLEMLGEADARCKEEEKREAERVQEERQWEEEAERQQDEEEQVGRRAQRTQRVQAEIEEEGSVVEEAAEE